MEEDDDEGLGVPEDIPASDHPNDNVVTETISDSTSQGMLIYLINGMKWK